MFSNTVVAKTSYTLNEVVVGAKFLPMYHRNEEQNNTTLNLQQLNAFAKADISQLIPSEKTVH
jgi:inward rectifier potassium channel